MARAQAEYSVILVSAQREPGSRATSTSFALDPGPPACGG